jgi:xanthine dehydrogenase FAD-binding subunit
MEEEMKYFMPDTLEEALEIMDRYDVIPLAGGSDLMVSGFAGTGVTATFPKPVMFLANIDEMKGITKREDGSVVIGALSTSREIATSELVHPLIKDAASRMGAIALRNSATIGGNIGNASPKGDTPQPLILLDSRVVLTSVNGSREMLVDDFIIAAKKTKREKNELITAVIVPPSNFTHIFFRKIGMRRSNAISKLTLSAAAEIRDGVVVDFRASSGAAGPKVMRSRDAELMLVGKKVEELEGVKEEFLDAWNNVISPHAMAEYRRNTTRRMLNYFIDELIAGHPEGRID